MSIEVEMDSFNLLNITLKLRNGDTREFNIKDELAISKATLNEDVIEQPGKYAWWAAVAEQAKHQRDHAETELDKAEAQADYNVRLKLELDGIKITEALVKQNIKLDKEYLMALNTYNLAKKNAATLDKVVKAFDQRMEALINLGANLRKEENNADISLKSMQDKARTITNK